MSRLVPRACALATLLLAACGDPGPSSAGAFAHLLDLQEDSLLVPRPELLPLRPPDRLPSDFRPDRPGMEYDRITYLRRRPGVRRSMPWAEHPQGSWELVTNSLGMREDGEPLSDRPDLRILVTGDSHTDGVVSNEENYCQLLEARLAEQDPARTFEVLNTGTGYYTFPNYLGVLVKYLELEPDVFVVCVYGGNDFGSMGRVVYTLRDIEFPEAPAGYRDRLLAAQAVELQGRKGRESLAQGFNQLAFLAAFPEMESFVLEEALRYSRAISDLCIERDIDLLVVYLPPPGDAQPVPFAPMHERVAAALELDPADLEATDRIASAYLEGLAAAGIETLDLRPILSGLDDLAYWRTDEHLNQLGHRVVAEQLEPLLYD